MYWNAVLVDQTYTEASGNSKEVYIANLYGIFSYVSLKLFWLLLSQPLHRATGCWVALAQLLLPQIWIEVSGLHMTNGHIRQQPAVLVERLFSVPNPWYPAGRQDSCCPAV